MISVVTFKWGAKYTAAHVNRLRAMVDRFYSPDARVICVTNNGEGIDSRVDVIPDDEDFADMISPSGRAAPSCYRRLRIWRKDAGQVFGEKFVCIDLDVCAVDDLRPLWDRPDPIVLYRDPLYGHRGQHCGSMALLKAGAAPHVWETFDELSVAIAKGKGFKGSDQAWLSCALPHVPTWSTADGVYSYRKDVLTRKGVIPPDARLVIFHGNPKPWDCGQKWAA